MIYNFRFWLACKLFQWGKAVHPEMSKLTKQIKEAQDKIGKDKLLIAEKNKQVYQIPEYAFKCLDCTCDKK